MNKRIISKVGKRHRPDIDMMEFMQIEEMREFDLDRNFPEVEKSKETGDYKVIKSLTLDDIESVELFNNDNDDFIPVVKTKKPC